jgi:Uma2 family endonuclease
LQFWRRRRVSDHVSSTKILADDFLLIPEDGRRHELIDGNHYLHASPDTKHQRISMRLIVTIGTYLREHPLGQLYFALLDVVLSPHDVVEPDLIYIGNERREIITDKNIQGAPDLIIEIVSDSTRHYDQVIKHALYDRASVGEYWLIDSVRDYVRVFRRGGGGTYERAEELYGGDRLTSPLFATLEIPLNDIFED